MRTFRRRSMGFGLCGASLALSLTVSGPTAQSPRIASPTANAVRLRHPVALALTDNDRIALTANEQSGTVSIVDLGACRVLNEVAIGKSLSDMAIVGRSDEEYLLVADRASHRLCLLARRGSDLSTVASLGVSPYPVSIVCDKNGRRCFVASLWSRRLSIVDIEREAGKPRRLKPAGTIPLPFAPRLQCLSSDGRILVVADAFRGDLGAVSVASLRLDVVKSIPGHNIRGLAWSPDGKRLYVAHQTVSPLGHTSSEDVHWGSVVSNVVRSLDRKSLERPDPDILTESQLFQLGDVGQGAGDPASLAVARDGTLYVALAGTGEMAAGNPATGKLQRLPVGIRPTALAATVDGSVIYAADTFGDSIAAIKRGDIHSANGAQPPVRISLGPQPALTAAERGQRLFFDARLSHDGWMSCHSCHTDGQSGDQLSDTLGDGSFGAPKRIPALGGVGETGPWAWNGSVPDLAQQVRKSLETTMRAKEITDDQVRDLTEYVKTLEPAPPAGALEPAKDPASVDRGRAIFARRGCADCHVAPTYTSPRTYDVGLRDEAGSRKFNPPSLRGVSQRAAFFHDGRAGSLEAVFAVHRHPGKMEIPAIELADLLAFLRTL